MSRLVVFVILLSSTLSWAASVRSPYRVGNARLRASLWMPTLTAVRRNAWLKAYYEGLRARGKLPKVALVASMRKLLAAVHFVAKNRKPFVPILAGARA